MHNLSAKVNDSALPWYSPLLTLLGSLRKSGKAFSKNKKIKKAVKPL